MRGRLAMPRGSRHIKTGLLAREGRWLVLQRDGGGRWRLDAGWKAWRLVGQRVRIEATRADFDLLDVWKFERL